MRSFTGEEDLMDDLSVLPAGYVTWRTLCMCCLQLCARSYKFALDHGMVYYVLFGAA